MSTAAPMATATKYIHLAPRLIFGGTAMMVIAEKSSTVAG
jgi:hypothetical protein